MRNSGWLIPLIVLVASQPVFSQEYSYTHYDITDGLAGSTVYALAQDKDGFLWASTETGVSRFDGTHFWNFTIADGLPDIEVLQLYGDRRGRMWMAPFRKSVCFWYKGRIHNQDNDSTLTKIHLRENIENFLEDVDGNILIQEASGLHLVRPDGTVKEYYVLGTTPVENSSTICLGLSGHFRVQVGSRIVEFMDTGFRAANTVTILKSHPNYVAMSTSYLVCQEALQSYYIFPLGNSSRGPILLDEDMNLHISFTLIGDSLLYTNEITGCLETNIRTGATRRFLLGKPVSKVFSDSDGNLWFATMGQGIFRLNSDQFSTRTIPARDGDRSPVTSILRLNRELWVGNDRNQIIRLSLPEYKIVGAVGNYPIFKNRILYMDTLDGHRLMIGTDNTLGVLSGKDYQHLTYWIGTIKSIARRPNGHFLVAVPWGVGDFDPNTWQIGDTIWPERSTAVFDYRDTVYIGSLNGLYRMNGTHSVEYLGRLHPMLRNRVSAIVRTPDGMYWIGTYGAGIIGYRGDSVIEVIDKHNGLTSDICRNLVLRGNKLWMGSDRGLNEIDLSVPGYRVATFTSKDGLGSDIINAIYIDSPSIYVGTPAGLSYFNPDNTGVREGCRLYLLSVMNSGRRADTSDLRIPFGDRSIRFEFAAISYRSAGDITYRYRMMGLDTNWRTTMRTDLEYPVLPPGTYAFQLLAVNKFGISSPPVSQRFLVLSPFWRTAWFDVLAVLVFMLGTWGLTSRRIRTIRRRQEEKDRLTKRMMDVERMALQAQMNPHFIFNCLTSVQQYIVDRDIPSANKYIAGLARLIRLTLHNSSLAFISLAAEVDYLSAYLELEKLRFKEKMEYSIEVDPQIHRDTCLIPPMLIQPYVENSIRHGLRHKPGGRGYIWVRIRLDRVGERSGLTVIVEDNGIGRQRSASYKTSEHIEYQSKGMTMTADRIRIINAAYGGNIGVDVHDLEDSGGQPSGTRVVMHFSLFDHLNQKETS